MKECSLCRAKLFWAMTVEGTNIALDRNPDPQGEWVIRNGRAERHTDQSGTRYRMHRCGGKS